MIQKLISGGQSGADLAALDVALRYQIPHGGWCPKGRLSEDGCIPLRYKLTETPSTSYLQRTEWNVRDSDATVIFTLTRPLSRGSMRTLQFAQKHQKPCIHIGPGNVPVSYLPDPDRLAAFLAENRVKVLNVAGSRESKAPGIHRWVMSVLEEALGLGGYGDILREEDGEYDKSRDPEQPGQSWFAFSLAPAPALHAHDER